MDEKTNRKNQKVAALLPLLGVGIAFTTIGMALQGIGVGRFALMGVGLLLVLTCLLGMLRLHGEGPDASPDAPPEEPRN